MAIDTLLPFPRDGDGHPLVMIPTWSPARLVTTVEPRTGAPLESSPTLRLDMPFFSWSRITCAPGKSSLIRLGLATVQASPASIGEVLSSISFPYKQRPASSLRESLAPRPAKHGLPSLPRIASAKACVWSAGQESSTPSSPVYPHLVTLQSISATRVTADCMKPNLSSWRS